VVNDRRFQLSWKSSKGGKHRLGFGHRQLSDFPSISLEGKRPQLFSVLVCDDRRLDVREAQGRRVIFSLVTDSTLAREKKTGRMADNELLGPLPK
jgi:hypothetical protein